MILEEPDNCLESAIEIKIQPPGKSVQNINLFSGGEKSLAALALLFSVLKVTPSPFCIYDEVEAALDDVNVERFAKYMRRMTDKTQFISITHRRGHHGRGGCALRRDHAGEGRVQAAGAANGGTGSQNGIGGIKNGYFF